MIYLIDVWCGPEYDNAHTCSYLQDTFFPRTHTKGEHLNVKHIQYAIHSVPARNYTGITQREIEQIERHRERGRKHKKKWPTISNENENS